MSKYKNGRPSKKDQIEIERDLRYYFLKSYSATLTSQRTGYNKKTILKYFNKWKKEILEVEDREFLKYCKEENKRFLLTMENETEDLYQDQKEVELSIKAARKKEDLKSLDRFYRHKLSIKDRIFQLISNRINLINVATADTIIDLQDNGKNSI